MKVSNIFRFILRIISFGKYPPLSVDEKFKKIKKEREKRWALPEEERERRSKESRAKFIQEMKNRRSRLLRG